MRVFVSSGDDALPLRDFVDALVQDGINAVLMQLGAPLRFEVDRWERTAPHKVLPDATPNEEFVARALKADLVLCILFDRLGAGTQEELEAVLGSELVELSVLLCAERDGDVDTPARRWLYEHIDDLFWDWAGLPDTTGPPIAIVRIFLEAVLSAFEDNEPQELMRERR